MSDTTYQTKYATTADAEADGWMRKPGKHVFSNNNGSLLVVDVSGGNSFGYAFALRLLKGEFSEHVEDLVGTTTIHLAEEKNRMGSNGCYREMFRADEFEAAVEAGKRQLA